MPGRAIEGARRGRHETREGIADQRLPRRKRRETASATCHVMLEDATRRGPRRFVVLSFAIVIEHKLAVLPLPSFWHVKVVFKESAPWDPEIDS